MDRPWTYDLEVGDEIEFVYSDRTISREYQPGVVFTISRVSLNYVSLSKDGESFGIWDYDLLREEFKPLKKKHRNLKGVARFFKEKETTIIKGTEQ